MLWNHPKVVFHILKNSDPQIVQTNLAPFICHNFISNNLSGNYVENNLLYIITMMLKDEINKLENINQLDNFLNKTQCGYLLEELIQFPDIQLYFKKIITKPVEQLENTYSSNVINFNTFENVKEINMLKGKENNKSKKDNKNSSDKNNKDLFNKNITDLGKNDSNDIDNENNENIFLYKQFIEKYYPDLTIKEIGEHKNNAKKKNYNNLFEYYNKLEKDCESNKDEKLYSNTNFIKNSNDSKSHLEFYKNHFFKVTSFISDLLTELNYNTILMPISIKSICKIITILLKNKFKEITQWEINAFISKFLIEKLLIPTLLSSHNHTIVDDLVISENTIKNLKKISYILKTFFSGKLYLNNAKEGNYTPFNWFFIENMNYILSLYDKVSNVNLPSFIEKYINDKLPKDYSYDYFEENKERIFANISICFNIENLLYLINGLNNYNGDLFNENNKRVLRIIEKLKENIEDIKNIVNKKMNNIDFHKKANKNNEKKENIEIVNYYLINMFLIDKKYEKIFRINISQPYFFIRIREQDKLNEEQKNVIKAKNYLYSTLANIRLLNNLDYNIDKNSNTYEFLLNMKRYIDFPNFILDKDRNIPYDWNIFSLLYYLDKIPKDYKKDDFKKLFCELSKDMNDKINNIDFEKLILLRNNLKFYEKLNIYYDNVIESFNNNLINKKIKKIVEEAFIPVDIIFNYDKESKRFDIAKSNVKEKVFGDKMIYEIPKKKIKVMKTIEAFTKYFPDLSEYQKMNRNNPFEIIKELSINKKLKDYLVIIRDNLIKKAIIDNNNSNAYIEKIKNYIMTNIYEKIYPPDSSDIDNQLFQKAKELSWMELKHCVNKKIDEIDIVFCHIIEIFRKINIAKTPIKKMNFFNEIYDNVGNVIKFYEGNNNNYGLDDSLPIITFSMIKAHPLKIITDIEFIKTFNEEDIRAYNLDAFNHVCDFITGFNIPEINSNLNEK